MEKYKIVVVTTDRKKSAQQQYNLLTRNNMNADIKIHKIEHGELYSVEVGPYSRRKPLLQDLDQIKGLGISNAFITSA